MALKKYTSHAVENHRMFYSRTDLPIPVAQLSSALSRLDEASFLVFRKDKVALRLLSYVRDSLPYRYVLYDHPDRSEDNSAPLGEMVYFVNTLGNPLGYVNEVDDQYLPPFLLPEYSIRDCIPEGSEWSEGTHAFLPKSCNLHYRVDEINVDEWCDPWSSFEAAERYYEALRSLLICISRSGVLDQGV